MPKAILPCPYRNPRKRSRRNSQKGHACRFYAFSASLLEILRIQYRILNTPYFLILDELGKGEDIDRFPVPRGMFTPKTGVIC